jgi:hypothetical protein
MSLIVSILALGKPEGGAAVIPNLHYTFNDYPKGHT